MMQQSFLDPDDCGPDHEAVYSTLQNPHSHTLHHQTSPVFAKKLGKSGKSVSHLSLSSGTQPYGGLGVVPTHISGSLPNRYREAATSVTMVNGGMTIPSTPTNGSYYDFPTSLSYGSHLQHLSPGQSPRGVPNSPHGRARISHPNLALSTFDTTSTVSAPNSRITTPATCKRSEVKSKTPPPVYRAIRTSSQSKKRHGSVGTVLDDEGGVAPDTHSSSNDELSLGLDPAHHGANGHLELFDSLIGKGVETPKAFINSNYRHKHSSSSPCSNRVHL